jgi:hypothetical protein
VLRLVIKLGAAIVCMAVILTSSSTAYKFLKDDKQVYGPAMMLRPELFRPEGERYRVRALWLGGLAIVLVLVIWLAL